MIENTSNPCYYHPIVHLLKSGHLHSMYLTDLQVSLLPCKYIRWVGNQTVRNFFWFNFFLFYYESDGGDLHTQPGEIPGPPSFLTALNNVYTGMYTISAAFTL